MKTNRAALAALLALGLASCTTTNGEQPGILQSMQQAVGMASMAVGIRAGDTSLAQNGANLLQQGLDSGSAKATPVSNPGPVAQADGTNADLQAVANRCSERSASRYSEQAQNVLMQRAACLSLCAYKATNIPRYYQMYQENQQNANKLCSMGLGDCNNIDTAYCQQQ